MLSPQVGVDFKLSGWNSAARHALEIQWQQREFDWPEIFRKHSEPDRLDVAIWVGDRLCGLGLATTTEVALNLLFFEGDARTDCPLKGLRILIFLDVAANYAQDRGKRELRVWPWRKGV